MTDTREQLLALAERVEEATGPDRALDIAIEKLLPCSLKFGENTPPHVHTLYNENAARFYGSRIGENDSDGDYHAARYTASLDAAMTLVPEGLHLSQFGEARFMTRSPCFSATIEQWVDEHLEARTPFRCHGVAVTPALALTAAALRAKASQ